MGIKPVLIIKIYSCHRHYSPTGLPSKNCYIARKNLYDKEIYTIRKKTFLMVPIFYTHAGLLNFQVHWFHFP